MGVYIKHLDPEIDDFKLKQLFACFGKINSAKIMKQNNGKSRGFGFVDFERKESATKAIQEMNHRLFYGKLLFVARFQTKSFRQKFIRKQLEKKQWFLQQSSNDNNYMPYFMQSNPIYVHPQIASKPFHSVPVSNVYSVASMPNYTYSIPQSMAYPMSINNGNVSAPMLESDPLTIDMLKSRNPSQQKRLIGERLFAKIQSVEPRLAGKITGMLLELDNTELLTLLSEHSSLINKVNEALSVLKEYAQQQSLQNSIQTASTKSTRN